MTEHAEKCPNKLKSDSGERRECILVLDFGSQFTQLIARRIREMGVYSEVHPWDVDEVTLETLNPRGVICSGGPHSVDALNAPFVADWVLQRGVPVLGICYGMQAMVAKLGGVVVRGPSREFGHAKLTIEAEAALFDTVLGSTARSDRQLNVWMSHGDTIESLPNDFSLTCRSSGGHIAGMENTARKLYGLLFHPEVTHTVGGQEILERFVLDICGSSNDWEIGSYIDEAMRSIRKQVGKDRVILGLSGGVDSSVAAALLHRAIGDQLTCVFVDHGLLRLNESEQVMTTFAENLGVEVIRVDASEAFFSKLMGVTDPEAKRKIIGAEFVEVFQAEAGKLSDAKWLAQGTIYSDVIESAGKEKTGSHTIKSHHNVGGLPETLDLKLLEPLRKLFKDEVRQLGRQLGLPHSMVYRHPFPGPGLGVRIVGEVKREFANMLRQADAIFIETLMSTMDSVADKSWYELTSQAFAVFLPIKSVGVMGDGRTYEYVVALRAVQTLDFMTAHWAHLPHELLGHVSNRIINEVHGINRVVYDISGKPPATIEWE